MELEQKREAAKNLYMDALRWNRLAQRAITDDAALDELYDHFFPIIYNVIYARVKNADVADEVVSDTFLKVCKNLNTFDSSKASFSTWISRIAIRTLTDYYRWQSHRKGNVEWEDVYEPIAPEKDTPESRVLNAENRKELLLALDKLDEREKRIVELKFWGDLSNKEIADTLDLTPNNVGVILHRAMGKLKSILGREE